MDESVSSAPSPSLADALHKLGITLPPEHVAGLARYAERLWDWNARVNLTRHTDWDKFAARDVVDSVRLAPFPVAGERLLDVGTGGGVPGIPLAILRPDVTVSLLDSIAKKMAAVQSIQDEIGLNLTVHRARLEEHLLERRYDVLTCRAVAPLEKLFGWLAPLHASWGRLLLVKGPAWRDELAAAEAAGLTHGLRTVLLDEYPLHGTDSRSVILEVR